jgi:hypothetical protein
MVRGSGVPGAARGWWGPRGTSRGVCTPQCDSPGRHGCRVKATARTPAVWPAQRRTLRRRPRKTRRSTARRCACRSPRGPARPEQHPLGRAPRDPLNTPQPLRHRDHTYVRTHKTLGAHTHIRTRTRTRTRTHTHTHTHTWHAVLKSKRRTAQSPTRACMHKHTCAKGCHALRVRGKSGFRQLGVLHRAVAVNSGTDGKAGHTYTREVGTSRALAHMGGQRANCNHPHTNKPKTHTGPSTPIQQCWHATAP